MSVHLRCRTDTSFATIHAPRFAFFAIDIHFTCRIVAQFCREIKIFIDFAVDFIIPRNFMDAQPTRCGRYRPQRYLRSRCGLKKGENRKKKKQRTFKRRERSEEPFCRTWRGFARVRRLPAANEKGVGYRISYSCTLVLTHRSQRYREYYVHAPPRRAYLQCDSAFPLFLSFVSDERYTREHVAARSAARLFPVGRHGYRRTMSELKSDRRSAYSEQREKTERSVSRYIDIHSVVPALLSLHA